MPVSVLSIPKEVLATLLYTFNVLDIQIQTEDPNHDFDRQGFWDETSVLLKSKEEMLFT